MERITTLSRFQHRLSTTISLIEASQIHQELTAMCDENPTQSEIEEMYAVASILAGYSFLFIALADRINTMLPASNPGDDTRPHKVFADETHPFVPMNEEDWKKRD